MRLRRLMLGGDIMGGHEGGLAEDDLDDFRGQLWALLLFYRCDQKLVSSPPALGAGRRRRTMHAMISSSRDLLGPRGG
jgi:hypothetical protein